MLDRFLLNFVPDVTWPKCQNCHKYCTFGTSAILRWVQNSIKNGPTSIKKQLSNQHPNLNRFWCQLGSILRPFWEPSWGQVGTKSLQKSIQKTIKNMITFWIALETDFDRFWAPTWPPTGETNVEILEHFGLLGVSWAQDGPRWPQDPPKESPSTDFRGFRPPYCTILVPNLVDFGPQLDGCWHPTAKQAIRDSTQEPIKIDR